MAQHFPKAEARVNNTTLFVAQSFCVPVLAGLMATSILAFFPGKLPEVTLANSNVFWRALPLFILMGSGLGIGFIGASKWGSLSRTGRWVAVLPVSMLLLAFGSDLVSFGPYEHVFSLYLGGDGDDEGLRNSLITCLALSCLGHSIGSVLGRRCRQLNCLA